MTEPFDSQGDQNEETINEDWDAGLGFKSQSKRKLVQKVKFRKDERKG